MRSFSLHTIFLLCLLLLGTDILAFYWLQSITQLLGSLFLQTAIHALFWLFTIGLIVSILVLKIRIDTINPQRRHLWISNFYGLTVSSFIPKLIFIVVISILYFANYMFSETQSVIIVPLVGLLSGFLPFFVIVYGIFRAVFRFKVYHQKIVLETLPKAFHGMRIVQLSDIHLGSFNYRYHLLERAFEKVNHLEADYIFITGDLINNYSWELEGWGPIFKILKANKGKLAVLGNHDYGDYSKWHSPEGKLKNFEEVKQFFDTIDFRLLLNESLIIKEKGDEIAIVGVENWGTPPFKQYGNLEKAMQGITNVPFKILLSHDPTHWDKEVLRATDIRLTLSGHTHGMQSAFQYKNFQWSPIKYRYRHWAGMYEENSQYLYVNRGLGWLGFPGRIGMRPEITCIELLSA